MANSVDITNGITKIVEITTQGPKGLKGDPGESPGFSTDIQVRNITSSGFISSNELTLGRIPYVSSSNNVLGGVIGDHSDLSFINQTLIVPGVSALRLVATNNITSSIISASNTTHTKFLRLPQAGGGGSGDGAIYFGSDPSGNNGVIYEDGNSLQLGYNDGDIISLRPSVISLIGNITASGNISGSSSSTASFGRVQASNIGGNSPLRLHDVTEINFGSSPALRGNPIFHGDVNIYSQSAFLDTNDNKFFESNDNGQGASATITFGDASNTRIHGSTIKLGSSTTQHVTASGNISASGDITAASASFNGKIKITGSLDILGNSPAITMTGDIHQARGGYLIKDTGSEAILILQHDANFGIADYAESVSGYNIYNQHTYQFAPRSVISGSFGMTQGFHNSATFYSFAQGRNTSCKPPLNNVGHWPYGNNSQGDSLTIDNGIANSGFNYGFAAHSEGRDTQANVPYSHAEGYGSITTGSQNGGNHAEGYQTIAEGDYAHSEGLDTVALGLTSHAEGLGTIASGSGQHAQGKYNTHNNTTSLMVIGNGASDGARSDLALFNTDGINFKTNLTASGNISGSGELYFSSSQHVGQYNNVLVQDPLTGKIFHTGSYGTGGSGEDNDWFITPTALTSSKMVQITASLTNGLGVSATGTYSHAEGRNTQAKGIASHAEGFGAISSGSYSHAEGYNTIALGDYSHAEGNETTAAGIYSHAQGFQTRAGGQFALSQGYKTTASGDYSFAFGGAGNVSEGDYSITTGTNNKAKGIHSQANGLNTQTSGSYSYAAGENTKIILSASHARAYGKDTIAKGIGSITGGSGSKAGFYFAFVPSPPTAETHSGHYSIAYGNHVETTKDYQAAFGQYNNTGSESSFNIGVGTSEADKRNIVDFGPTGSIKFDIGSLPNGDPGVEGQLYRTGSGLFGVNGDLQLLLISKG